MSLGRMLYGAGFSAILAVLLVAFAARDRRPRVLFCAGLAAAVMPIWWNLILRWSGATAALSHDIQFRPFPISWQDTGSGVFTLAGAGVLLTLGAGAIDPAGRVRRVALWAALAALLVDIYTY